MMRSLLLVFSLLALAVVADAQDLPRVYVNGEPGGEYVEGTMRVVDGADDTQEMRVKLKVRGATARRFEKKSLAVKIVDENGDKRDVALLGMRSDNRWILDAMAVDKARMRNRVAFDVWNDLATPSYIETEYDDRSRNGIDGRFVELWLNGNYHGIYCLNERLDRKQLRLKKRKEEVRGLLFKTAGFNGTDYWNYDEAHDNNSFMWLSWECHYPDLEDGPTDWQPLIDNIRFVRHADNEIFCREVAERFDLPVILDYIVFYQFIYAQDNYSKNQFAYFYDVTRDRRQGFAPWDMDASFGRGWDATPLSPTGEAGSNNLYYRLQQEYPGFQASLRIRYAELRETWLAPPILKKRFADYFSLLRESGAADRECARWNGANGIALDFDGEEQYIYAWIDQRVAFMDKLWGYTGANSVATYDGDRSSVSTILYNVAGQRVSVDDAARRKGIYMVGGHKVVF